ncbi:hypothetical protein [Filimonas effusa]|uniref:Uncharacterized protein n=1 Tax=Filimonas effusa TaxID=2508721 RepID=A0A4Q1DC15_9BACT|nr:hypothetical protein [Filimonas effusa]RXK86982.1 hypothetical protein ESB13_09425 [Filimonas effusa]
MNFVNEDAILIEVLLNEQRKAGKHWVAFDETIPRLSKDDLTCFSSVYDVKQYCFENSIGKERYTFCTIDKMQGAVEVAMKKIFRHHK